MRYFDILKAWCGEHTLLYPFLLFLASVLVSIYPQEIKRFLHEWPKTKATAHQAKRNILTKRLALLKTLHDNSYMLVFWLALNFVNYIFTCFIVVVVANILALFGKARPSTEVVLYICAGVFMGRCNTMRATSVDLSSYDETVTKLEQRLEE